MKEYPTVSLIISNRNGKELLKDCLNSLLNQNYPSLCEIIVVDAGSTDGTPKMVEQEFPTVKLLKERRIGIGTAINKAFRVAIGDILAFDVNNDEIFPKEWLKTLVDGLLTNPTAGVVGGVRVLFGTNDIVDEAGVVFDYIGIPSSHIRAKLVDIPQQPIKVDYVGLPLFHKRILNLTGLVDEAYVLYSEDSDFCAQVKMAGYDVLLIPQAVSYHRRSVTLGKSSSLSVYYERRNQIRFVIKNFSPFRMFLALFWYAVVLTIIESIMFTPFLKNLITSKETRLSFLFKRSSKDNFRAVIEAIRWNFKNLKSSFCARRRIQTRQTSI